MEKKYKITNSYEELKEAEEIYNKHLLASDGKIKKVKYPSLKYMYEAFKDRISQIKYNFNEIKEKIKDFEGNNIKEIEKPHENMNKLVLFEKEAKVGYEYYKKYLITLAKRSDDLGMKLLKICILKLVMI